MSKPVCGRARHESRCKAGLLRATATALPQMVNFKKEEENSSAVLKFDLKTGKLIKRYLLPNKPKPHALGDLTIDSNGNVFTTDSLTPDVYVIHSEEDEIEPFLENDGSSLRKVSRSPATNGIFSWQTIQPACSILMLEQRGSCICRRSRARRCWE